MIRTTCLRCVGCKCEFREMDVIARGWPRVRAWETLCADCEADGVELPPVVVPKSAKRRKTDETADERKPRTWSEDELEDITLADLARSVSAACDKWLLKRGIKSGEWHGERFAFGKSLDET